MALACATANAALIVKVEGTKGSGQTTWSFSGSDAATGNGTIRTSQSGRNFSSGDTFDRRGSGAGDYFIADQSIQNVLVALSGAVKLTIGSQTRSITHLFLDSDRGLTFPSMDIGRVFADDFGIRVNKALNYTNGQSSAWSGIATVNLDISKFLLGTHTFPSIFTRLDFGTFTITFSERTAAVAEPGSLALLALALAGLGFSRKLTSARSRA